MASELERRLAAHREVWDDQVIALAARERAGRRGDQEAIKICEERLDQIARDLREAALKVNEAAGYEYYVPPAGGGS